MTELLVIIWALPILGACLAAYWVRRPHRGLVVSTGGAAAVAVPWIVGDGHGPVGFPLWAAMFWVGVSLLVVGLALALILAVAPGTSAWPRLAVATGASALIATAVTVVINTVPMG